jgi:hypothetical protein
METVEQATCRSGTVLPLALYGIDPEEEIVEINRLRSVFRISFFVAEFSISKPQVGFVAQKF